MMFKPAVRKNLKLRMSLAGPAGVGKSFTALAIASGLGERIAVLDTEHGSASLYSDRFKFDVCEMSSFSPDAFIEAIKAAEAAKYDVLIIDSLSHEWMGKDGALEMVDNAAKRSNSKNTFNAWRDVTPKHDKLMEAIIQSSCHVIVTLRAKVAYELDKDDRGKITPKKLGLAPIQREGVDYLMTVAGDLDHDHNMVITKTRCSALTGKVITMPDRKLGETLLAWLNSGEAETVAPPIAAAPAKTGPQLVKPPSELAESLARVPTAPPPPERSGSNDVNAMRAKFAACTTLADLDKLVPEVKKLSEIDRKALSPDYSKRRVDLAAVPAAASTREPGSEG